MPPNNGGMSSRLEMDVAGSPNEEHLAGFGDMRLSKLGAL